MTSKLHNYYQNQLKEKLNASYVGWETSKKDGLRLKVVVDNQDNYFKLSGEFEGVTEETYLQLLNSTENE